MDEDFGILLEKTLHNVLELVQRINNFDGEEILLQLLEIEQILSLLNHISTPTAHLELSNEDCLELMKISDKTFSNVYIQQDVVIFFVSRIALLLG